MSEQLFVYEEDEQGYQTNYVLMAQEGDTPIDVERLEKLSWKVIGAGRFSTSAKNLIKIASDHGLKLRIIKHRNRRRNIPSEWTHLPLVRGATGNY